MRKLTVKEKVQTLWESGADAQGTGYSSITKVGKSGSKGLIAESREWYPEPSPEAMKLFYYPKPDHVQEFLESQSKLDSGGPWEKHSGSVGSLHAIFSGIDGKLLLINFVQGHYAHKIDGVETIKRATLTKYGGWRQHLFDHVLTTAKRAAITTVFFAKHSGSKSKDTPSIFIDAARKHGFTKIEENETGWVATKKS